MLYCWLGTNGEPATWHGRVIVSTDTEKLNSLLPKWRVRMLPADLRAAEKITVDEWAATGGLVWNTEREDWRQG